METVKYPFRVKYNGKYYAPGEPVKVENAEEAVKQGAEVIHAPHTTEKAKK